MELHKLKHVNVVKLYAMVFQPEHYGVVLEYVPNGALGDYIFKVSFLLLCTAM